jgi:hypothetical protein
MQFAGPEALSRQIAVDVEEAKVILRRSEETAVNR